MQKIRKCFRSILVRAGLLYVKVPITRKQQRIHAKLVSLVTKHRSTKYLKAIYGTTRAKELNMKKTKIYQKRLKILRRKTENYPFRCKHHKKLMLTMQEFAENNLKKYGSHT